MAMNGSSSLKRKLDTAGIDVKDDDRRDRCYKCGGRGHMQKECSTDSKAGSEQSCYKCQGKGHIARNCPNLSRDVCYFCGQMGHHGLDCPIIARMYPNLPPLQKKELLHNMHTNPQFANQVIREASMSYDPYTTLLATGAANPLQALMALLQQGGLGALGAAGGAQPALYTNPYTQPQAPQNSSTLSQYPGYNASQGWGSDDLINAAQAASGYGVSSSYAAYGAPGSPSQASQPGGVTTPSLYSNQPNPFGGVTDVFSSLRALTSAYTNAGGFGYGAPGRFPFSGHNTSATSGNNCYKCGQAGHYARECPNAPADGGVLCYRCGQSGHMVKECTNPPMPGASAGAESCFRCGERGHFSRDCTKNGAVPSKDACFRCGQPGHRTRECTGPDIRVCFVCQNPGHVSSSCPERTTLRH